ncbi:uncharacterized protein Z520_12271 [Fonsecaea multimorphosa CBS 102226]|uniref:Phenylacetyl-CoA ligase n=1 Tax=Fonsecaea multimorphosa CBS 102226 TaxID=1442371 RepID=A0A0D2GR56_9EURO|nr:uncharacterized protein Z520_12271 [Fonsecaea multimorphosa CBS 102226]KIX92000.1 hypothetical protein Z520_12271 [Fonsecaea multimorphosa CBS 102226]OAL17358.1 hypothetical protein AYO22_11725 [Fonsecaea multimorphosa]
MVFYPDPSLPKLPEITDTVPICDFMLDEQYGRRPFAESWDPYTCGLSGRSISARQQRENVKRLARALAKEFGWKVNGGTEYDKVVGVFALNTVDIMSLTWAIHRINGVSSPANAAYSAEELRHQLTDSGAKVLFTVMPLLQTALEAAVKAGIPRNRVYICEMANDPPIPEGFKTVGQLIKEGESLPDLEPIRWNKGQGARQTAFLCYSGGTSGLPKGVMLSHHGVITNTVQLSIYDQSARDAIAPGYHDVVLGLLPFSHIYALILICHASTYRGDQVIVLPKFDLQQYLTSIERFKINGLYVVPPIIIAMVKNQQFAQKFDLSSINSIYTAAAPLSQEIAEELAIQYPNIAIRQGYGLTETCTVVWSTSGIDIWLGSSGCLLPGFEAKIMDIEGNEITGYNQRGELLVKAPNLALGYLKNERATRETFITLPEGRFMRTGDEVEIRKSPKTGREHIWIVDRIKEMIKVKGLQVPPAELEACLLSHPAVLDCAVIPVHDERAGEVPKAFIVKSASAKQVSDAALKQNIAKYVEKEKARHKWLAGGIEFTDAIPKSPAGKILRRLLRDQEREARMKASARL